VPQAAIATAARISTSSSGNHAATAPAHAMMFPF
jgi:hypothetical protein